MCMWLERLFLSTLFMAIDFCNLVGMSGEKEVECQHIILLNDIT